MRYELSNGIITIQADSYGAELKSLKRGDREYLWNADPAFWGRTAPVLFPLVGSVREKTFTSHGKTYHMNQHGFARDTEFVLLSVTKDSITFRLASSPETIEKWPYEFVFDITYTLHGASVDVTWEVHNPANETMYFSIGAHPAFMCPDGHSYFAYVANDNAAELTPAKEELLYLVTSNGLLTHNKKALRFDNGRLTISRDLFKEGNGTLVFGDTKIRRVTLADEKLHEYVTVDFNMPLVALWSPDKENTPFVCIEPWCGVCDYEDADGIWEHRAYGNTVEAGKTFTNTYTITVD